MKKICAFCKNDLDLKFFNKNGSYLSAYCKKCSLIYDKNRKDGNKKLYVVNYIENEIWKDIPEYEGMYKVSNLGRVMSCNRKSFNNYEVQDKILTQIQLTAKYYVVGLYKNGTRKAKRVHRLMAILFIPNPENKPHINHINGDRTDNRLENLEWCTQKENIVHAYKIGLNKGKNWKKYER